MHDMPATDADTTHPCTTDQIMKDMHCIFEFCKVSVQEVKTFLLSIDNENLDGNNENLDEKLLRIIADDIATPIFKPTRNCGPSGLKGSKSHSAT
jgi:hypothetical protein